MSVLNKSFVVTFGILLVSLLNASAWGDVNLPVQYQIAPTQTASTGPVTGAQSNDSENSVTVSLSNTGSGQERVGDGRTGFWIVGILINLTVLGLFLVWAVKEWRKKRDG